MSDPGIEKADVGRRRPQCDHICLNDADHVERGEPHFYGYRLPSPNYVEAVAAWARDESMSESGMDDGPEVDTYEQGYQSAQETVRSILAGTFDPWDA